MKKTIYTVGARGSRLSVAQTMAAIAFLKRVFPGLDWRFQAVVTPGDRDLTTPLEKSAPDFFTRDLDDAVRSGAIDCAIHSAKDLPGYSSQGVPMVAEGLDWFWLPEREDPRDCWVFAGRPGTPIRRIGISSERRRAYAHGRFPGARLLPIRGAIDSRLEQLAEGKYDAVLMAMAGIRRLYGDSLPAGLRLEPIPLTELVPPEAQGFLAVTFRAGDERFMKLRESMVKAVRFVSAGTGSAGLCTLTGLDDLAAADVVLYDALMGDLTELKARLEALAAKPCGLPRFIPVGKRCGAHSLKQPEITSLICDEARKGRRVVRLKGGDAGLFGRLAEEADALERLRIPFVVRPGVSALTAATTGTGLLLTRRGESTGFTVYTPRRANGAKASAPEAEDNPLVMFMAVKVVADEARRLVADGRPATTPCAIVFDAAGARESIWRGTLGDLARRGDKEKKPSALAELAAKEQAGDPGLFIVGSAAAHCWPRLGTLKGRRMLVTGSRTIAERTARAVEDRGGRPILWPMIRLVGRHDPRLVDLSGYDAVVLTSPSAARIFFEEFTGDLRTLPKFFTCGAGTDAELGRHGVRSDMMPAHDFSAVGLISEIRRHAATFKGSRVLRLRSAKAGNAVAKALRAAGAKVEDVVLYDNVPVVSAAKSPAGRRMNLAALPPFDDVHFASASAVEAFIGAYGASALRGKGVFVMGGPTRAALPASLGRRARLFETWKEW